MNWLTLVTEKSFLLSFCPKKLEVAKIILVHLLQAYELLKTEGRVAALRKRQIAWAFSPLLRRWHGGKAGVPETSAGLCSYEHNSFNEGVGKTEADSPKIEVFNCVISAYRNANQACKQVADVPSWHSTWRPAHSCRYLRPLLKCFLCAVESDVGWWLNNMLRAGET